MWPKTAQPSAFVASTWLTGPAMFTGMFAIGRVELVLELDGERALVRAERADARGHEARHRHRLHVLPDDARAHVRGDPDVVGLLAVGVAAERGAGGVVDPLGVGGDLVVALADGDGAGRLRVARERRGGEGAQPLQLLLRETGRDGAGAVDRGRVRGGVERREHREQHDHQDDGADQRLDEGHAVFGGELRPQGNGPGAGGALRSGEAHVPPHFGPWHREVEWSGRIWTRERPTCGRRARQWCAATDPPRGSRARCPL